MSDEDITRLNTKFGHLYTVMIVSGSIIKDSSPQCQYVINKLKGLITREKWETEVKPLALKHGLLPDTEFLDLQINKLHKNCRHEFTPAMFEPGDKIGENEILK